jgi:hypothetical protein
VCERESVCVCMCVSEREKGGVIQIGTDPAGPADSKSVDSTKTLRGTLREYISCEI